jgi:hypothetical protein
VQKKIGVISNRQLSDVGTYFRQRLFSFHAL